MLYVGCVIFVGYILFGVGDVMCVRYVVFSVGYGVCRWYCVCDTVYVGSVCGR